MSDRDPIQHAVAYADGTLPQQQRAAVERLLAADPAARAAVDRLHGLRAALGRAVTSTAVPDGLADRVAAALREPGAIPAEPVAWVPMRSAVDRAMRSESAPAGLAGRIREGIASPATSGDAPTPRRATTRPRSFWILRLGLPGLATAAAIVLAVLLWPAPEFADAAGFVRIHEKCAVSSRHDTFGVQAVTGAARFERIRSRARFAAHLPDLSAGGGTLELDGACTCSPVRGTGCIHTYFRDRDGARVVSVFIAPQPFALAAGGTPCAERGTGEHTYCVATSGGVTLVAFEHEGQYFVITGRLDEDALAEMRRNIRYCDLRPGHFDLSALAAVLR